MYQQKMTKLYVKSIPMKTYPHHINADMSSWELPSKIQMQKWDTKQTKIFAKVQSSIQLPNRGAQGLGIQTE